MPTPYNNPYIPGDPYSYDLKWIVKKIKKYGVELSTLDERIQQAIISALAQHDPIYFTNADELIQSPQTDYSLAYIEGYYEAGDGGANLYYVTSDYNDVLAANYYLTLTGANRWAVPILTTPYVTPEMFGAVGDGLEDDTQPIKTALLYNRELVLSNIYAVRNRPTACIKVPSNKTITFLEGAVLKAINENLAVSTVLSVENSENVIINAPHIVGDADSNTDTSEGAGHLISIRDSKHVTIKNASLEKAHTDGIYCIRVEDAHVYGALIKDVGRNGFTVTAGKDVDFHNSIIENAYRAMPKAGVSVEPNYDSDYIDNINIHDVTIKRTGGLAFYCNINKFVTSHSVSVRFYNIEVYDAGASVAEFSATPEAGNAGSITVKNICAYRTFYNLFLSRVHANNGVLLDIEDCRSFNSNVSGVTTAYRYVFNTPGTLTAYGNYYISNIVDEVPEKSRTSVVAPNNVMVMKSNMDQLLGEYNTDIAYIGEFPNAKIDATPGTHSLNYREFYATTSGAYAIRTGILKNVHCKFYAVTGATIQFNGATIYKPDGTTFNVITALNDGSFIELEWFDTNKAILIATSGTWTMA